MIFINFSRSNWFKQIITEAWSLNDSVIYNFYSFFSMTKHIRQAEWEEKIEKWSYNGLFNVPHEFFKLKVVNWYRISNSKLKRGQKNTNSIFNAHMCIWGLRAASNSKKETYTRLKFNLVEHHVKLAEFSAIQNVNTTTKHSLPDYI